MEKYICDICGFILEADIDIINNGHDKCPICKGKLISEEQMKEKEEIARLTDEDIKDDDYTPEQDSMDEVVDLIIIEGMTRNMKELGNDKLYQSIEGIKEARQRARYRKYFLQVGGYIPLCEPLIIK